LAKEAALDGEAGQRELAAAMNRAQALFEQKLKVLTPA
jgi:hypothetical protein